MKRSIAISLLLSIVAFFCLSTATLAGSKEDGDVLVNKSRVVMEEMFLSPDKGIPRYLIEKCSGLAIIPDMIKGGFIVGGSYGKGVVMSHKSEGWAGPSFIYIGAGSLGFQIGVQSTDLILVIIGQKTMDAFLDSQFKLGADVAIAAGPIGAQATAATEIMLKGGIYSYSRAKGLFAGVSLEGAAIGNDFDLNRAYYSNVSTAKGILQGGLETPPAGRRLREVLNNIKP